MHKLLNLKELLVHILSAFELEDKESCYLLYHHVPSVNFRRLEEMACYFVGNMLSCLVHLRLGHPPVCTGEL